ncbi:MAG TPA: M48 family metallopeptidase [Caulobacteraceae bacterium]
MGAVGLQTYIWNNNIKSTLLLLGFPVLLLGMVYTVVLLMMGWGYLPSAYSAQDDFLMAGQMLVHYAPMAIGAALLWFVIAYFSYQSIIDASTGARPVSREEQPRLYNLLENLAISRGMQTPTPRIIETEAMNAFATGLHEGQYSVAVTTGLLDALDDAELEAVLAHEMTHVINRDVRLMVIASVFAGIVTLLAQIIYRSIVWSSWTGGDRRRRGGGAGVFILVALAVAAVGWVLALVIRMAISRRREYVADAGAVELTKNPDAMISALQKISGHSEIHAPSAVRSMFLDDDDEGVMGLFATHPPIAKRIEALVRYAGGRVGPHPDAPSVRPAPASQQPDAPLTGEVGPWGRRPGPWG